MTFSDCITIPTTNQLLTDVAVPNCTPADPEAEFTLSNQVDQLWARHAEVNSTKKASAAELRVLRQELSERLYNMKALLCSTGRNSRWRGWLRERAIPRSTADRLVSRYAELLGDSANVLGEDISPSDAFDKLLNNLLRRVGEALEDDSSKYRLLRSLSEGLGLRVEDDDWGFAVLEPEGADEPQESRSPDPYEPDPSDYHMHIPPDFSDLTHEVPNLLPESVPAAAAPPRKYQIGL